MLSHLPFGEEIIYSSPVKINWDYKKEPGIIEKVADESLDFLDGFDQFVDFDLDFGLPSLLVALLEIPLLAKEADNKIRGEIYTYILAVPTGIILGLPTPLSIIKPQKHKSLETGFLS